MNIVYIIDLSDRTLNMTSIIGPSIRLLLFPLAFALLAGCVNEALEADPSAAVTITPKVQTTDGIDVYRGRGDVLFRGPRMITVVTSNGLLPVKGASCLLENDLFEARFTTPAYVRLPDYGQTSPLATVTCELDGRRGVETLQPINLSAFERDLRASRVGQGFPGSNSGLTITFPIGPREFPSDQWGYPDVFGVTLR